MFSVRSAPSLYNEDTSRAVVQLSEVTWSSWLVTEWVNSVVSGKSACEEKIGKLVGNGR
jgi:hypothetical protein